MIRFAFEKASWQSSRGQFGKGAGWEAEGPGRRLLDKHRDYRGAQVGAGARRVLGPRRSGREDRGPGFWLGSLWIPGEGETMGRETVAAAWAGTWWTLFWLGCAVAVPKGRMTTAALKELDVRLYTSPGQSEPPMELWRGVVAALETGGVNS